MMNELEELQAGVWRELERCVAEHERIKRDTPPPPYGTEERAEAYETLRLRLSCVKAFASAISALAEWEAELQSRA